MSHPSGRLVRVAALMGTLKGQLELRREFGGVLGQPARRSGDHFQVPLLLKDVGQPDLLLEHGIHDATVADIQAVFVDPFPNSLTRADIFQRWQAFRDRLRNIVTVKEEFIDGSFVTSREDPADIDASYWIFATDIDALSHIGQKALHQLLAAGKPSFLVHAFLVPECGGNHPAFAAFDHTRKWTRKYWKAYQDPNKMVVPGVTKGYLRMQP